MNIRVYRRRTLAFALGACMALGAGWTARAEVWSVNGSPRTGAIEISPGEGVTSGNNLFFQFRVFNIFAAAGESVTFKPPSEGSISNVVTHVRGDPGLFFPGVRASIIDGPLVSEITGANFFLMNPQGVIFGPNAAVSVSGNFYASSADRLEFTEADGSVVTFPDEVQMTSAEPSAFGFLGPNPASVSVMGAVLSETFGRLALPTGGAVTLVGGDVSVSDSAPFRAALGIGPSAQTALLEAPSGSVNLVSVAGESSVPVNLASAGSVTEYGEITIRDSAVIDAHDVYIRGGRLVVEDSIIAPGITPRLLGGPASTQNGGGVRVHVSGDATLDGSAKVFGRSFATPGIYTFNTADGGDVPAISVEAGSLTVRDLSAIRSEREGAGGAPGIALEVGTLEASNGGLISSTNASAGGGGDVTVKADSVVLSGGDITTANTSAGGDVPAISVEADSLTVRNASAIRSERKGAGAAAGITLEVGALEVSSGGLISSTNARSGGGADVTVQADSVAVAGAGITASNRLAGGPVGDVPSISVIAAENLTVSDGGVISSARQGEGGPGAISIDAGALTISSGGIIGSVNLFNGPGPDVNVTAGPVQLRGDGGVSPTGLFAQARSVSPFGLLQPDSGSITLAASSLTIANGAEITTDSLGLGRGGSIAIDVAGAVALSRDGASKGGIFAQSAIAGNAGSVSLRAASLQMRDGFPISAITAGFGDAGSVGLDVAGNITLNGDNTGIFSRAQDVRQEDLDSLAQQMRVDLLPDSLGFPDEFMDFDQLLDNFCGGCSLTVLLGALGVNTDPGAGGSIDIAANDLTMNADTRIDASTVTDGPAGDLDVRLRGSLLVRGGAQIRGRSGLTSDGVVTAGSGAGGQLNVQVADLLTISGVSATQPDTPSAITTSALGAGDGGDIFLQSRELHINGGGTVSASSEGTGLAGDITIEASEQVLMNGGIIATEAKVSDGGNITLNTQRLLDMFNSEITTSVESGEGGGGNINIDPDFVVLQNSRIIANAFGGPGGNITIVAGQFIISPNSVVQASSARSVDGNIDIDAPDTDIVSSLAALPDTFLDATSLLKGQCDAARGVGGGNSLVVSGRGGVPPEPDGYVPSLAVAARGAERVAGGSFEVSVEGSGRVMLAHVGVGCA